MERSPQYKSERLIPESQLREAVSEILAQMLGIATVWQRQWYNTDPAYKILGLDSPEQLREMVREGILRLGQEVRDIRSVDSSVPRYQFHIEKCESRLNLPPEKRQIKKIA